MRALRKTVSWMGHHVTPKVTMKYKSARQWQNCFSELEKALGLKMEMFRINKKFVKIFI